MIGILFLLGIVVWITLAVVLSKRIPRWVGITKHTTLTSVLLFPLVLAAPVADDLIGRWQFYRLCDREALVTLSADWEKVKRARVQPSTWHDLDGYVMPIQSALYRVAEVDSSKIFMESRSFFTKGGWLPRHLSLSAQASSCHPKNIQAIQKQINLFELLKQGETK